MCAPVASLHDRFLALQPKIETHGRIAFRQLHPNKKEEVLQEMRALAWKWFLRLSQRGKDAAEFISTFNTFLARAIRNGRRIMGQQKAKDAMCEFAQRRHGFRVQALPNTRTCYEQLYADVRGQHEHDALDERLKDNMVTPVPDQAAFRIDWPAWLRTLANRSRPRSEARYTGTNLGSICTPNLFCAKNEMASEEGDPRAVSATWTISNFVMASLKAGKLTCK